MSEVSYDPNAGVLYVYLSRAQVARQVEMPDGVIVDVDEAGHARGIEVISPWGTWDPDAVARRFNLDTEDLSLLHVLASTAWPRWWRATVSAAEMVTASSSVQATLQPV